MVRDYIYVKDVAEMISRVFVPAKQDLYNLGSGQGVSIHQLIETIRGIVKRPIEVIHQENLATFVDKIVLDNDRFRSEFGLAPKVSLEDGIRATWEYVLEQVSETS